LGVRDIEKGELVIQEIKKSTPKAMVESMQIDLASFASVRKFAELWKERNLRLDILVCNAGIIGSKLY
jgi:NAD(P)-dependent dehydrogenase (short-subunit alcohol dehydrogenase family)